MATNLEKLINALDLDALPTEEREAFMVDLNTVIFKQALARMIEQMDEATREDFAKLMEREGSEEELEAFFTERVPGAAKVVEETVQTVTDDILAASETD